MIIKAKFGIYMSYQIGIIASLVSILSACGGGGGGGGSSSSNNAVFPSNAVLAEANEDNSARLARTVVGNSPAYSLNNVAGDNNANPAIISNRISKVLLPHFKSASSESSALNAVSRETVICDNGGSVDASINGNFLRLNFNNCRDGSYTLNGIVSGNIVVDSNDYIVSFNVRFESDLIGIESGGNVDIVNAGSDILITLLDPANDIPPIDTRLEMTTLGSANGSIYGCQDCVLYVTERDDSFAIYQTQGRIYIADNYQMFVNYDQSYDMSRTPAVFRNSDGGVNDGGQGRYLAANGDIITIRAENGNINVYINNAPEPIITL